MAETMQRANMKNITAELSVYNNWSCVHTQTPVMARLRDAFSEFSPSARFTKLFKLHKWDGRYFMVTQEGVFGTGLLPDVEAELDRMGVRYTVSDERTEPPGREYTGWKWTGGELRDVQERSLEMMKIAGGGIIKLATGAGKSRLSYRYIHDTGLRTLFVVPRSDLMYQSQSEMSQCISGADIELIGDGNKGHDGAQVTIVTSAMLVSIWKQLGMSYAEWASQFHVLFMDECHRAGSDGATSATWQAVMGVPACRRFGMSATPFEKPGSLQGMYVRSAFGGIIADSGAQEGVEDGYLVPCSVFFLRPEYPRKLLDATSWNSDDLESRTYAAEHDAFIAGNETRNKLITQVALDMMAQGHKTLVVAQRIPHNDLLYQGIRSGADDKVFQFHGKTPERKNVMDAFRAEKGPCCMVASSIANDGIDVRDITCVIAAHGGKSFFQVVQRIGRGLRADPGSGKRSLTVVDFDDTELGVWFSHHAKQRRNLYKTVIGAAVYDVR